ncbi:hypothetical protein PI125_g8619 [Phytophthora idaei]|nr:hypothetical protein PI125_g8619 [Phytophthora idaei]
MTITPTGAPVHVPELDVKMFANWDALEAYLKNYSRRRYQIFSIRTNTTVRTRNQRIRVSKTPGTILPEAVQFYNKTYMCTHYGKLRSTSGQGVRPNQHSRKLGCLAQISACVRETGNWEVCIAVQRTGYNHEVNYEAYQNYHEARRVSNDEVLSTVRILHRADRLQQESNAFPTIEERIQAILKGFSSHRGNVTRIYANEENVAQCISIQSAHMRSMFEHFPEVLLVDATHDSNSSNYKLFSFMVNGAIGKVSMYSAALLNMSGKRSCGLPVVSLRIVIHPMIL